MLLLAPLVGFVMLVAAGGWSRVGIRCAHPRQYLAGVLVGKSNRGVQHCLHGADAITEAILQHGQFEPNIAAEIVATMSRASNDSVFVDVGANVGVMTMAALAAGHNAIAIEALPGNVRLIHCSAALNGFNEQLQVHNVALTSPQHEGSDKYCVCGPPGNPSDGIMIPYEQRLTHPYCKETVKRDGCVAELTAVTMDTLLRDTTAPIGVLKADVEGFEYMVLKGATQTLKRLRPCLIITEYNVLLFKVNAVSKNNKAELTEMFAFMENLGFREETNCMGLRRS